MKKLLSVISEKLYHQQVDEKLVITKDTKEKSLDNIKQIHWANLYNALCYFYLDTKFIYELRDTTNDAGDIYYVSFRIDNDNMYRSNNKTFFKKIADNIDIVRFDIRDQLLDSISKNINKIVSNITIFSVKDYFNSLLLGIVLYIKDNKGKESENIIYLVSADQNDLNEITKMFIDNDDNWEIYDKDIYKALYK